MDLNDGVGLSQLAAQAVIFLGEVSDPTIFGLGEVDLASTLLRFQRGALGGGTLLAPGVQMGGVNPFLAQQSADFARLGRSDPQPPECGAFRCWKTADAGLWRRGSRRPLTFNL